MSGAFSTAFGNPEETWQKPAISSRREEKFTAISRWISRICNKAGQGNRIFTSGQTEYGTRGDSESKFGIRKSPKGKI